MPLSVFQLLFKANLIFKDFSNSPVYSSTFQACANPEQPIKLCVIGTCALTHLV